jgi:type II secretory pathway pseudopilin PulG
MRLRGRTNRGWRHATRGVTVLELLIVMTILLMITAATIPFVTPAVQNRRMRESSRLVSTYVSAARSRAIETGRSVGVLFQRFNSLPLAYTLSYVEMPPPYAGESASATASVTLNGMNQLRADMGILANFNPAMLRVGDQIQFNFQGPRYTITGPDTGTTQDGTIDSPPDSSTATILELALPAGITRMPWNNTPALVSYQIFRQPVGSPLPPLQLPEGICVDLFSSGIGSGGTFPIVPAGLTPADWTTKPPLTFDPIVMFGPGGGLEWIYVASNRTDSAEPVRPTGPVYFLIGRRDLMADVSKASPQVDENVFDPRDPRLSPPPTSSTPPPTYAYLENFWITVSPQTGLVTVTQMSRNPNQPNQPWSIADARLNAITGQQQGGR